MALFGEELSVKVLFAGAGLSAPFGLPVMRNFFDIAIHGDILDNDDKTFLTQLRLQARQANALLLGHRDDLEHILSFAMMLARNTSRPDSDTSLTRLRDILGRVMSYYPDKSPGTARPIRDLFLSRFHMLDRYRLLDHDCFVTTNYDITIEFLHLLNDQPQPSLPGTHFDFGAPDGTGLYGNGAPLCKLHGSVNWHMQPHPVLVVQDEVQVDRIDVNDGVYNGMTPKCTQSAYRFDVTPFIVPPTFFKAESHPALDDAWSTAHQALAKATEITFVGYSFPPSDTHMRYFLGSALMENANIRRIRVIDPRASHTVGQMQSESSTKFGNEFMSLLKPIAESWYDETPVR